jgi:cell division septation protein DedD
MFAQFAKLAGYSAQWSVLAEEQFIVRTLAGDVHAIGNMLDVMGIPAPKTKRTMLAFLAGDALVSSPIKGDAAQTWPLFCKASAAALGGDRTLCDTFERDAAASIATAKANRAAKKALKAASTPAASTPTTSTPTTSTPATSTPATSTPATSTPATSTPVVDPVAAALEIVNAAVNAGTLTAEQCAMLCAMVERLNVAV